MVEDTPDDLVFELHNEALWGAAPVRLLDPRDAGHGRDAAACETLRALHARAYHPAQIVVAAAGNVEHDELLEVLERTGWLDVPRGDDVAPVPAPAP